MVVNKGRLPPNQPSTRQQNKERKKDTVKKSLENKIKKTSKESEKTITPFILQNEISKIKINSISFIQFLKNNEYREKITKMVRTKGECQLDTLEWNYDAPTMLCLIQVLQII